ncbi:MAG: hypothetical protein ABJB22_05680 [Verrucomicrobiota bacterium]
MKNISKLFVLTALLVCGSTLCLAQSSSPSGSGSTATTGSTAPYTEGSVWEITMVHVKPGMGDDYLKGLAKNLKTSLEEEKKQGLIVSYKVLLGDASSPGDYNIMNMVEYKNMAALDNLREKTDPIAAKIIGSEDQMRQGAMKRAELRDIIGSKTMREITLK